MKNTADGKERYIDMPCRFHQARGEDIHKCIEDSLHCYEHSKENEKYGYGGNKCRPCMDSWDQNRSRSPNRLSQTTRR